MLFGAGGNQEHWAIFVFGDFRGDNIFTLTRLTHDVEIGMEQDSRLDKTPFMVGISDFRERAFGEIKRVGKTAGFIEDLFILDFGAVRNDADDTGVVFKVKRCFLLVFSHYGPAAFMTRRRHTFCPDASDGPRPVLFDFLGVENARYACQVAGERVITLCGAFQFSQTDKDAQRFGSRHVVHQAFFTQKTEGGEQTKQGNNRTDNNRNIHLRSKTAIVKSYGGRGKSVKIFTYRCYLISCNFVIYSIKH